MGSVAKKKKPGKKSRAITNYLGVPSQNHPEDVLEGTLTELYFFPKEGGEWSRGMLGNYTFYPATPHNVQVLEKYRALVKKHNAAIKRITSQLEGLGLL